MRSLLVFALLLAIKGLSRLFYRHAVTWTGETLNDFGRDLRLIVLLNHTSLFELLYLANAPIHLLWRIARHGIIPAADKTIDRPFVGMLFSFVAHQVVPISRERDDSWNWFLSRIDPEGLVLLAPEGRMMRKTGLDSEGRPMTVRGGIADILLALGEGNMLLVYSGGLHHVQVPGHWPRAFKTVKLRLERVQIASYVRDLMERGGPERFKKSVKEDLEQRRDLHCGTGSPPAEGNAESSPPEAARS